MMGVLICQSLYPCVAVYLNFINNEMMGIAIFLQQGWTSPRRRLALLWEDGDWLCIACGGQVQL